MAKFFKRFSVSEGASELSIPTTKPPPAPVLSPTTATVAVPSSAAKDFFANKQASTSSTSVQTLPRPLTSTSPNRKSFAADNSAKMKTLPSANRLSRGSEESPSISRSVTVQSELDESGSALLIQRTGRRTVKMQGFAERQDRLDGQLLWRRSFAVLEGGYIHYFMDENQISSDPNGFKFPVHLCFVEVRKDLDKPFVMEAIVPDQSRREVLSFADKETLLAWMRAVVKANRRPANEYSAFERILFEDNAADTFMSFEKNVKMAEVPAPMKMSASRASVVNTSTSSIVSQVKAAELNGVNHDNTSVPQSHSLASLTSLPSLSADLSSSVPSLKRGSNSMILVQSEQDPESPIAARIIEEYISEAQPPLDAQSPSTLESATETVPTSSDSPAAVIEAMFSENAAALVSEPTLLVNTSGLFSSDNLTALASPTSLVNNRAMFSAENLASPTSLVDNRAVFSAENLAGPTSLVNNRAVFSAENLANPTSLANNRAVFSAENLAGPTSLGNNRAVFSAENLAGPTSLTNTRAVFSTENLASPTSPTSPTPAQTASQATSSLTPKVTAESDTSTPGVVSVRSLAATRFSVTSVPVVSNPVVADAAISSLTPLSSRASAFMVPGGGVAALLPKAVVTTSPRLVRNEVNPSGPAAAAAKDHIEPEVVKATVIPKTNRTLARPENKRISTAANTSTEHNAVGMKSRSVKMQGYLNLHVSSDPPGEPAKRFYFELQGGFLIWHAEEKRSLLSADVPRGRLLLKDIQIGHGGVKEFPASKVASSEDLNRKGDDLDDSPWFGFVLTSYATVKRKEETTVNSESPGGDSFVKVKTVMVREATEYTFASHNRVEVQSWVGAIETMIKLELKRSHDTK